MNRRLAFVSGCNRSLISLRHTGLDHPTQSTSVTMARVRFVAGIYAISVP